MVKHKSCKYIHVYVYFHKYLKSSKHVSMLQKQKNSFLIFWFWGGGGGLFKISSYSIVAVHPDIKIEFFLKKYFGHTLQYPCKLNIVLFVFLFCNVVNDLMYDEIKLNLNLNLNKFIDN